MQKAEYKDKYHERTGPRYQKNKILSKAWIANNFFSPSLIKHIYKTMDNFDIEINKDMWNNFKGCKKVLEIGSGKGVFLLTAPEGVEAEGIEIIDKEINESIKKGLKVIKADAEKKLPFKDNSFDGVYLCNVIEHFEKPYRVIEEVKRILKKGGKLIILTPNFANSYKDFYNDYTHKRPFTKRGLFKLLSDLEFNNIQIKNETYHSTTYFSIFLNYFPKFKISLGNFIAKFYGPAIRAIAEK